MSLSLRLLRAGLLSAGALPALAAAGELVLLDPLQVQGRPAAAAARLDGTRVAQHKPLDLAETLARELPSVSLIRKGPLAGDFLLRGLGRDNLRLSLDGLSLHGACPNRMDPPAFHVSSQQIDRVLVRPGPFDVEDAGTIGGVVRLATPACCDTPHAAQTGAGSFGYRSAGTSGRTQRGAWTASGSLAWQQGEPYADGQGRRFTALPGVNYRAGVGDGRAFTITQAEGKLAAVLPHGGLLDLQAGFHRADNVLYPGLRMDARRDESWRAGARWTLLPAGGAAAERVVIEGAASGVYHDMRDDRRTSSAPAAWAARGWMMRTLAWTRAAHLRALAETSAGDWQWRYGAGVNERRWDADNRVMQKSNDMLPDVVATTAGAFAVGALTRADWGLETGVRLDRARTRARAGLGFVQAAHGTTSNARGDWLPSGYLIAHRTRGAARVYAGLGHGSRSPDPQERYQNLDHPTAGDWVGNPDLAPVRSTEAQAGASLRRGTVTLRANLFHAWLDGFVYLARLVPAAGSTANRANTKTYAGLDARLGGGDVVASWEPAPGWRVDAGLAAQRGVKRGPVSGAASRVLGEIPAVQARAGVQWESERWTVRLQWQGAPRQNRVDPDLGEVPVAGWSTVGTTVAWRPRAAWEFSLGVDNLLDRAFTLHNAYTRDPFAAGLAVPEPGRFLFARVAWRR